MRKSEARLASDPVRALEETCHTPFAEAWASADERIAGAFRVALEQAREEHEAVMKRAGLDGPPPSDAMERSERLVAYRRECGADLLSPLLQALERVGPVDTLGRMMRTAEAAVLKGIRKLPQSRVMPWEEGAFAAAPFDARGRRFRKGLARLVGSGKPGTGRDVPLRSLASEHVVRDLLPSQCAAAREVVDHACDWLGALEAAITEWSDRALPVLLGAEALIESQEGEPDADWTTVSGAAAALQEALAALPERVSSIRLEAVGASALDRARSVLTSDVRAAGGFVYSPSATSRITRSKQMDAMIDLALVWESEATSRLQLHASLLAVLSGGNSVQGRLVGRLRATCVTPTLALSEVAEAFDAFAREAEKSGSSDDVGAALAPLREQAMAAIEEAIEVVPDPADVEAVVRAGAEATVESLQAMIRQVPSKLSLHSLGSRPQQKGRAPEARIVPLQEMARQAFDALRMERIRAATHEVTVTLAGVCQDAAELPNVVSFGFDAARDELAKDEQGNGEQAARLAAEALTRTADALRAIPRSFEVALAEARVDVAEEIAEGCEALFERAGARRIQAQLLAAQSRFSNFRMRLNETLGPELDRAIRWGRLQWTRGARVATRARRRLERAFGAEPVAQAKSSRTIRTLAAARAEGAPLVYQRLFSLDPVSDPALLAGRDAEIHDVMGRWSRWQAGDGVPTLIVGRPGIGVTSFVNVVMERLRSDGAEVAAVQLSDRVAGEAELVETLASTLGVDSADTFDGLAKLVLRSKDGALPQAVALDTLEHVYLRAPGGTDLFERFLTFMSETEPKVFWIGGITTSAWQLVQKSEPTAVSQVEALELHPLTTEQLRVAVTLRHRRSGLQIHFSEPEEGRQLLRRRLRRVRGTHAHQDLLEADFFDRLHRASLGTLRLALFQWLLAADFETGDGEVRMGSMERPDFSVLDQLDLTQNFTLKGFLEHRTLTLSEHDAVFRMPRHESYQIFESLGNRHLIEHIDKTEGGRAQSEIVEGLRYRVKPLLTGAVIAHLERRNIIH